MVRLLKKGLQCWRTYCDDHAKKTVLVLGDSHVRVFEHWWFMWRLPQIRWHIIYVPGGTATGLYNPKSITQTYSRFIQGLNEISAEQVVLCLGEVDAGYNVWFRAERENKPPEDLLDRATKNYSRFIQELAAHHKLIVLSAPLPTLPDTFSSGKEILTRRKSIPVSQLNRTELTLAFNDAMARLCSSQGIPYLDDRYESLGHDGLVKRVWLNHDRFDHHYNRRIYAKYLARKLEPLLNSP